MTATQGSTRSDAGHKLRLPGVTLLCVDTRYPGIAVQAMQRCLAQADFARAVLIADAGWKSQAPEPIEVAQVESIRSVPQYSHFMLKRLGEYVATPHVLIVQWDSFILDAGAWDERFLDYDYVGAPWPGRASHQVGNGGFSLRSRRLIDALRADSFVPRHPEDECICWDYGDRLERESGIRFAPLDLATRFAFELKPHPGTFGFHGFFNFARVMPEGELLEYLKDFPTPLLFSLPARRLAKNAMREGAFDAARYIISKRLEGSTRQRLDALKLLARLSVLRALPRRPHAAHG